MTWRRALFYLWAFGSFIWIVHWTRQLGLLCTFGDFPLYSLACPGWIDGWPYIDGAPAYMIKRPAACEIAFVPPVLAFAIGYTAYLAASMLRRLFHRDKTTG